jgi:hypothetical protein
VHPLIRNGELTSQKVIKFVDRDAPPEARQITAVDRGILELKSAVENMHAQVNGIQHKIDELSTSLLGIPPFYFPLSYIVHFTLNQNHAKSIHRPPPETQASRAELPPLAKAA